MATTGDEMAPSESGGAGEKFQNLTGMSSDQGDNATTKKTDIEHTLKQPTFPRFKVQHPKTMENLPDEILTNIFIRLLAKQLAQMRSVSKYWNGLLSQSSFIKSHLHRSIHNSKQKILLVFPNHFGRFKQYSSEPLHLEPTNFIKHIPSNLPMHFIGAVNGLICLSEFHYSNIHIWNPSLSAVLTIPLPHLLPPATSHYMSTSLRFGFDPKTDDYKFVRILGSGKFKDVIEWLEVQVYSMRKGSWESITQPFPSHITDIHNTDYLCVDGHDGYLHWQIETVVMTEETILTFDLGSETFHEIPLPDSILDSNHKSHQLGVLDGKLCEMSWCKDGGWEVWVMEEYGVPESWVKRHVFPQLGDWKFTYGLTSRNELFLEDEEGRIVLYDPIKNKAKSTHTSQSAIAIVEYVDSLVWVKNIEN